MSEDTKPVHDVHEAEIRQLKSFGQTYGKSIGIAVCAALVVISGIKAYQYHQRSNRQESLRLMAQARSVDELQDLVTRYRSTPAAPLSLLKLAKVQFDRGNYSAAVERYEEFATTYPEHDLIAGAQLGKVFCLEASDDTAAALAGFQDFVLRHPDHYLAPQARLGEGRCLQRLGKRDEARAVYEDFVAANPESAWTGNVKEALELLDKNAYVPSTDRPERKSALSPIPEFAPPIMAPEEAPPGESAE